MASKKGDAPPEGEWPGLLSVKSVREHLVARTADHGHASQERYDALHREADALHAKLAADLHADVQRANFNNKAKITKLKLHSVRLEERILSGLRASLKDSGFSVSDAPARGKRPAASIGTKEEYDTWNADVEKYEKASAASWTEQYAAKPVAKGPSKGKQPAKQKMSDDDRLAAQAAGREKGLATRKAKAAARRAAVGLPADATPAQVRAAEKAIGARARPPPPTRPPPPAPVYYGVAPPPRPLTPAPSMQRRAVPPVPMALRRAASARQAAMEFTAPRPFDSQ